MRKSGVLFHIKFLLRGTVLGNGGSAEHLYPGALRHQTQDLLYLGNALSLVLSRQGRFSAATMLITVQWHATSSFPKELLFYSLTLKKKLPASHRLFQSLG